jgi:DNA replicative helicase MCM subunit Mcm2 (Cdc46/Mcm family)
MKRLILSVYRKIRRFSVTDVDLHEIRFQCQNCGQDLHQTIRRFKANEHMTCPGAVSEDSATNAEMISIETRSRALCDHPSCAIGA